MFPWPCSGLVACFLPVFLAHVSSDACAAASAAAAPIPAASAAAAATLAAETEVMLRPLRDSCANV